MSRSSPSAAVELADVETSAVSAADAASSAVQARRFSRLFALLVALPLLAQASLNWLVNPWGLYRTHLVPPRVVDEHYQKTSLLRQMQPPPEQLVLGTSRVMRFEPSLLEQRTGLRTFNAAIPGIGPVDLLVLYRYATEELHLPLRRVIVGIDSLIFFVGDTPYRTLDNNTQLRRYLPEHTTLVSDVGGLSLLLSTAQTRDAAASLRHAMGWGAHKRELWRIFDADGFQSRNYQDEAREHGTWPFEARVAGQLKSRYFNPKTANPMGFRDFEQLLALLQAHGTETIVLMTPALPRVHTHWAETGFAGREAEIRRQIAGLAATHGARFIDYSTVETFGGDATEFYDASHPTVVNTRRMITSLFPDATQARR